MQALFWYFISTKFYTIQEPERFLQAQPLMTIYKYQQAHNSTTLRRIRYHQRRKKRIEKYTPSKAHRRTERGMISPPKLSFFSNSSPGREKTLTLISVHMPTAAIEL
jgi:hypothetical protein